jgi:Transposase DDE domain
VPGCATVTGVTAKTGGRSPSTARPCAAPNSRPTAASSTCSPRWTTPPARYWPNAPSTAPPAKSLGSPRLAGVVVTADALHTHAEAAEFLVTEKHAHYLFTVKANQPTLLACCAGLPWRDVPVLDRTRDRAHGRVELRTLKAVTITHVGFPYAAQVLRVTRKTRDLQANSRRWRTVVVYAITSLPFAQASPARLADLLRGHWAIEAPRTPASSAPAPPRRSWLLCTQTSHAPPHEKLKLVPRPARVCPTAPSRSPW